MARWWLTHVNILCFLTGGRNNNTTEQGWWELVWGQHQRSHRVLPSLIRTNCCAFALKTPPTTTRCQPLHVTHKILRQHKTKIKHACTQLWPSNYGHNLLSPCCNSHNVKCIYRQYFFLVLLFVPCTQNTTFLNFYQYTLLLLLSR